MKTIYNQLLQRLEEKVPQLKWIDLDCGQYESNERPAVALPCCLLSIEVADTEDITETIQDCKARISARLAFENTGRTAGNAPEIVREKSLQVYDTIADVYKALQGFETENFEALRRTRQGKEKSRHGYFQYHIDFVCEFEDLTAE